MSVDLRGKFKNTYEDSLFLVRIWEQEDDKDDYGDYYYFNSYYFDLDETSHDVKIVNREIESRIAIRSDIDKTAVVKEEAFPVFIINGDFYFLVDYQFIKNHLCPVVDDDLKVIELIRWEIEHCNIKMYSKE